MIGSSDRDGSVMNSPCAIARSERSRSRKVSSTRLRLEMSLNVTTAPIVRPSRRTGCERYSTGNDVPSARQKTSSSECAPPSACIA